eukprot:6051350-Pyramimonas_sp.AAC.1
MGSASATARRGARWMSGNQEKCAGSLSPTTAASMQFATSAARCTLKPNACERRLPLAPPQSFSHVAATTASCAPSHRSHQPLYP